MPRTYSGRDDAIETLFYTPLKKRSGLTVEQFNLYWKDAHGPLCARLPGLFQYKQFHLDHDEGGIWPAPEGVVRATPPDEQLDGIAELTFTSPENRQAWVDAGLPLMIDEQNCFDETIGYLVQERRSRTYYDVIADDVPNGFVGVARYHVLLKKHDAVSFDELREYLTQTFATNAVEHELLLKLRLHLLDEYTKPAPPAPNVFHEPSAERQIHAAFEIAFATRLELHRFLTSDEYAAATEGIGRIVRQMSVFAERAAYSLVEDGAATLMGQRSPSVARTITDAGAVSNLDDDVVALMVGGRA
jgi:EthD domain-containing protein